MVFGWNFFQNLHNFPLSLLGLAVLSFFALLRKTLKTFYIYYVLDKMGQTELIQQVQQRQEGRVSEFYLFYLENFVDENQAGALRCIRTSKPHTFYLRVFDLVAPQQMRIEN